MRFPIASFAAALAAAILATAGTAPAAVPPGNSGADEYAESYPSAGGNEPSAGSGEPGANAGLPPESRTPSQALGEDDAARLDAVGSVGRATAELAAETAPGGAAGDAPTADLGGGKPLSEGLRDSDSDGVVGVAAKALGGSGSGGMGLLLPAILLATLCLAAGVVLGRRQRHRELSR